MATAMQRQKTFSGLLWYLAASLVGSWSWLLYLLYVVLR